MISNNGILQKMFGEYIAAGARQLPDAETAAIEEMTAMVSAGWLGQVRVTYRRQRARHHKHSHWYWTAVRADPLGE